MQGWSLEDDEEEDDLLKPETSGASGKDALVLLFSLFLWLSISEIMPSCQQEVYRRSSLIQLAYDVEVKRSQMIDDENLCVFSDVEMAPVVPEAAAPPPLKKEEEEEEDELDAFMSGIKKELAPEIKVILVLFF